MASDTSLIFNLLGKDRISPILAAIRNAFRSTASAAEQAMDEATVSTDRLDNQIQETERHLAELRAEFAATGDKTLFGKIARDRSLLSNLQRIRAEIGRTNGEVNNGSNADEQAEGRMRALASAFGNGVSQISNFASGVGSTASSLWGFVSVLAAVVAALAAIGPGLALAGGALGSIPALLGGGIAAIGTLKLGLGGLSSEYKRLTTASGGGGGGAAKAAKDFTAGTRAVQSAVEGLASSERDVTTAQREALQAQLAVNAARETAADRIRDQALDMQTAQLDQKDAADAVTAAQFNLNQAMASNDPSQIAAATEALQRAQIAAEQAKNKTDDLTQATALNAKTGVEGSDEVVQAKQREADARQRVADSIQAEHDAETRLQDARKDLAAQKAAPAGGGGGGGAAAQVTQLAPAARAFLNTIIALRPAFTNLRLDVQQHLFAGLATPMKDLAKKWLPQLHTTLDQFADTFNGIAKTVFATASKKTFIDNMAKGAGAVRKAMGEIGKAVGGPLLDAFGRLSAASAPFIEKLGHLIAGAVTQFSAWIKKADESHKLTAFFKGAADTLQKVWDLGKNVVKIIGQFIAIIFPQAKSGGDGVLDSVNGTLTKISNWLKDPKHQQYIKNLVTGVGLIVTALWQVGTFGVRAFGWVVSAMGKAKKAITGLWEPLKNGFKDAVNWIIGKWNNLHFTIGGGSFLGASIPSATFNTPDIQFLANGGNITRSGLAVVGERGPELVSLTRGAQVTPLTGGRAGGGVITLNLTGADAEMKKMIRKWFRTDNLANA